MFKYFKRLLKKIVFSYRCDSESYIEVLRKGGAQIGERVRIFDPLNTIIDRTRPFMLKIGNDVQITSGVVILTHGYDWSVLKGIHGEVLGSTGEVTIGDNCFIGMNTTILKGVHIGNNCIIGANSLVNKDIPDNMLVAGNPAKPIMTIEQYYEKRVNVQLEEAAELYRCYESRINKGKNENPPIEIFDEFFWLFQKRAKTSLTEGEISKMRLVGNFEDTMNNFLNSTPMFNGYDEFLKYLKQNDGI